jgi:negative regulator of flagellin synthesis FlgM
MQINNSGITNNTNTSTKQKPIEDSGNKPEASNVSGNSQDSVVLSNEAQALKQLEAKIVDSPDVDTAKVESILQAIADGSYTVNADSIAQKLLGLDNE